MNRTNDTLIRRLGLTAAAALMALAGGSVALGQQDRDDMEWEPDEGYHEQEWYDPSDWFDAQDGVDYEDVYDYDYFNDDYDNQDYGDYNDDYYNNYSDPYYDDYYNNSGYYSDDSYNTGTRAGRYDYGWHRDYNDSWDYGWHYDRIGNYDGVDYDYNYYNVDNANNSDGDRQTKRQLKGRVTALERVSGGVGQPDTVRVRFETQDGNTRTLQLGDVGYISQRLPAIQRGDEVVIGGHSITSNGREYFKAREMRAGDQSYLIPEYEYQRRIEGDLVGLRKVKMRGSNIEAMVAEVRTDDGERMKVLLGDAGDRTQVIRPGTRIRVDGYSRDVNGTNTFIVQDVKLRGDNRNRTDAGRTNREGITERDQQRQQQMDRERQRQQQTDRERQRRQQDEQRVQGSNR